MENIDYILKYLRKCHFLPKFASFTQILGLWKTKSKIWLCHFFPFMVFYLHAKNQKNWSSSYWEKRVTTDGRTDGIVTDGRDWFHRTRRRSRGFKRKNKKKKKEKNIRNIKKKCDKIFYLKVRSFFKSVLIASFYAQSLIKIPFKSLFGMFNKFVLIFFNPVVYNVHD